MVLAIGQAGTLSFVTSYRIGIIVCVTCALRLSVRSTKKSGGGFKIMISSASFPTWALVPIWVVLIPT
jgi:hypothetical protein